MKRLILIAMLAAAAQAQVLTGSLVGDVTDASGAAVPGATVKITQAETNEARQSATNESGAFSFPAIPAGTYSVEVLKSGR